MNDTSVRRIQRLELYTPDLDRATTFYTQVWGLVPSGAATQEGVDLAAATGLPGHLTLRRAPAAGLGRTWFSVDDKDALQALFTRVSASDANVRMVGQDLEVDCPLGLRIGVQCAPPSSRQAPTESPHDASRPMGLTHVVINTPNLAMHVDFLVNVLGFRVSDVTARMVFMRCGRDHHSLALATGDAISLNHAAFAMHDIDGLMYGTGRLIEHGHPIEWGLGRHGPGNNVFCYFVDPDGFAVEYTTDMEQVDESYVGHDSAYWDAFPNRPCRWGVARKPSDRLMEAFAGHALATEA